jgi:excisionase family DNA binding protein
MNESQLKKKASKCQALIDLIRTDNNCFTVNQLADYFGVNPKTIYRRLWAKQIPAFKVGKTWRIAKKDIKWLRQ